MNRHITWLGARIATPLKVRTECCPAANNEQKAVLSQGEPCDAAVKLDSLCVEFYNGIVRFLFHSTAFLYTSVTVQNAEIIRSTLVSWGDVKSRHAYTRPKSAYKTSHGDQS